MTNSGLDKYQEYLNGRSIRFYLTLAQPCPYLPNRRERKIFATLDDSDSTILNEALTHSGFRRSQTISYRPACDMCAECVSIRIIAKDFIFDKKWKRILKIDKLIYSIPLYPEANEERFDLIKQYLNTRHLNAGMSNMNAQDFISMIEEGTNNTRIIDYRLKDDCELGKKDELIACSLLDELSDGKSLIYSFFNPNLTKESIGSYIILDQIRDVKQTNRDYIYLGYLIKDSKKMAYKARFKPFESLGPQGWQLNNKF